MIPEADRFEAVVKCPNRASIDDDEEND